MATGTTYPASQLTYEPMSWKEALQHRRPSPGAIALSNIIVFYLHKLGARAGGIYNFRPVRGGVSASLHAGGRALDIMVPNANVNPALGNWIFMRAIHVAVECGICEIIWNNMRWTPQGGVQHYAADNHDDHVHIGLTRNVAYSSASIESLQNWFSRYFFYDFALAA